MLRSAVLLLLVGCSAGAEYNYNRCDSVYGPTGTSGWTGACKSGVENTPIDLCGAVSFPTSTPAPSLVVSNYNVDRTVSILNNGHTIQVNMPTSPVTSMTAGTLSTIVGRSTASTTTTWVLAQIHLHWGRSGKTNEGSEHYMQGKAYPAEAHFVHYDGSYSSITDAIKGAGSAALLVVGVFLEVSQTSPSIITAMGDNAKSATQTPTALSTQYKLNDLFDGSGSYYSYKGGLTTPECSEIVTWIVMTSPKGITSEALNKLKTTSTSPSTSSMKFAVQASSDIFGKYGNYRPLQKVNSRTVYLSSGTSAACTTVTEPTFSCNAGLLTKPSLILALLAFSFLYTQQ